MNNENEPKHWDSQSDPLNFLNCPKAEPKYHWVALPSDI